MHLFCRLISRTHAKDAVSSEKPAFGFSPSVNKYRREAHNSRYVDLGSSEEEQQGEERKGDNEEEGNNQKKAITRALIGALIEAGPRVNLNMRMIDAIIMRLRLGVDSSREVTTPS